MIDKGVCDKGFIWNPSNCKCECEKSCDIGEYLDYENCKCTKQLVDKLAEECTENINEVKIAGMALFERRNERKSSYTIYVVLIVIVFTINIGIATYFFLLQVHESWQKMLLNTILSIKHQTININGKYQRNKN